MNLQNFKSCNQVICNDIGWYRYVNTLEVQRPLRTYVFTKNYFLSREFPWSHVMEHMFLSKKKAPGICRALYSCKKIDVVSLLKGLLGLRPDIGGNRKEGLSLGMTFQDSFYIPEKQKAWLRHDFHPYLYLACFNFLEKGPSNESPDKLLVNFPWKKRHKIRPRWPYGKEGSSNGRDLPHHLLIIKCWKCWQPVAVVTSLLLFHWLGSGWDSSGHCWQQFLPESSNSNCW